MEKDPTAKYIIIGWWAVIALSVFGFPQGFLFVKEEEPQAQIPIEQRCKFIMKTTSQTFNLSEPSAGTYKYELYASPDGYVEVWKCP